MFVGIANVIYTYTSSYENRATYKDQRKSGRRIEKAKSQSIDILELQAVKLAIKPFFREYWNHHIRIKSDDMMAIAYINFSMMEVPII